MDLTPYLQRLRDDLLAAASLGDEHTRRAAALLTTTLEPAARLAMMSALSDLAAEVTGALQDTTVDIRLDGTQLRVSVDHHESADSGDDWSTETSRADATAGDDGNLASDLSGEDLGQAVRDASEELSRTTLRLVQNLKAQAEQAANAQGVSLNTYIQRAVSDAVRQAGGRARHHGGRRGPYTVSGFVQG